MILVYSAVLSAYVYKYVALHIRRCLRCVVVCIPGTIANVCAITIPGPFPLNCQHDG